MLSNRLQITLGYLRQSLRQSLALHYLSGRSALRTMPACGGRQVCKLGGELSFTSVVGSFTSRLMFLLRSRFTASVAVNGKLFFVSVGKCSLNHGFLMSSKLNPSLASVKSRVTTLVLQLRQMNFLSGKLHSA